MFYGHQKQVVSYHSQLQDSNLNSSHPSARLPHGATHRPPGINRTNHVGFEVQPGWNQAPNAGWIGQASLASRGVTSSITSNWTSEPGAVDVTTLNSEQSKVVQQPIWCDICKIKCYSKGVFDNHVAGKKHQRKVKATIATTNNISSPVQVVTSEVAGSYGLEVKPPNIIDSGTTSEYVKTCTICNVVCSSHEVLIAHVTGKKHAIQAGLIARYGINSFDAQIHEKNTNLVPSLWCEVCKVLCNSVEDYTIHILGKKHRRYLEQIRKSKSDINITHSISVESSEVINENKRVATMPAFYESPQTKKQKVMEDGVSAVAITVCTLCNTSCYSFTDFTMHLIGQKHLAMMEINGLI